MRVHLKSSKHFSMPVMQPARVSRSLAKHWMLTDRKGSRSQDKNANGGVRTLKVVNGTSPWEDRI